MTGQGIYGWLVRMHPQGFRDRFGSEMIWIYEQEQRNQEGDEMRLIWDGVVSLGRQWWWMGTGSRQMMADGHGVAWIAPRRWVEGAVLATTFVAGVLVLLGNPGRGLGCLPVERGGAQRLARGIEAPGRIRALTAEEAAPPVGAKDTEGVDRGAAAAVLMVKASGYCAGKE